MFTVGMMYLNPYQIEDNCCAVMEIDFITNYLEYPEIEYHIPIISLSILVFAYF